MFRCSRWRQCEWLGISFAHVNLVHSQSSNLTRDLIADLNASALSGSGYVSPAAPEWKEVILIRQSILNSSFWIFPLLIFEDFHCFHLLRTLHLSLSPLRLPTTAICFVASSVQDHLQPFPLLTVHQLSTMKSRKVTFFNMPFILKTIRKMYGFEYMLFLALHLSPLYSAKRILYWW